MSWQRATVYKNTVTECLTNKLVKCSVNSATDYSILTTLAYWVYIRDVQNYSCLTPVFKHIKPYRHMTTHRASESDNLYIVSLSTINSSSHLTMMSNVQALSSLKFLKWPITFCRYLPSIPWPISSQVSSDNRIQLCLLKCIQQIIWLRLRWCVAR